MSQKNVEIVRRICEKWASGDFGVGVADFDPHVMIVVPPVFLESGVYVGPDGIGKYTRRFLEQYERVTIEARRLQVAGDTILAEVVQQGTGRASGIDMHSRYFILFTFRGGRIVRMESVQEESDALDAAGLRA
jgi:ketosteroid isomerase-like protein